MFLTMMATLSAGMLACTDAPTTPQASETSVAQPVDSPTTPVVSPEATRPEAVPRQTIAHPAVTPEATLTNEEIRESVLATLPDRRKSTIIVNGGPIVPCRLDWKHAPDHYDRGNMVWHPDDSSVFFINQETIWEAQADGSGTRMIADPNPPLEPGGQRGWSRFNFHLDVSPDGSTLVYSTCEYQVDRPSEMWRARYYTDRDPAIHKQDVLGYELATIDLETLERRRLTEDNAVNHFPAWAPDGRKIAHLINTRSPLERSNDSFSSGMVWATVTLIDSDGQPDQTLVSRERYDYPFPPVWSPNSQYLAVAGYKPGRYGASDRNTLNILKVDDLTSPSTELGETTAQPTWSPDGTKLAFANRRQIYTVNPDGTDRRHIWWEENPITHLHWHPDGSEILVSATRLFTITPDGAENRKLTDLTSARKFEKAMWSPDGSELAAHVWQSDPYNTVHQFQVITIAREGSEARTLAVTDFTGKYYSTVTDMLNPNPPRTSSVSYDTSVCADTQVVPKEHGPSLMADCKALLEMASHLALNTPLNWGGELPITEWEGISLGRIDGELRVTELILIDRHLGGVIPSQIGQLTGLQLLALHSWEYDPEGNFLTGTIPSELGNMPNLRSLDLSGNNLTGTVPESLNSLTTLRGIDVRLNYLSGCVSEHLAELMIKADPDLFTDAEQAAAAAGLDICTAAEE